MYGVESGPPKPPPRKTFLENVDLVFKVLVAVGTLYVGYLAFQLNDKTAANNNQIANNNARIAASNLEISLLKQQLEEQRFGQDQVNAAYDRVERYLADKERTSPRCNAIIYYVKRLPDRELVTALMEILGQEATSLCIQSAASAVVVEGKAPSVPTSIEAFQKHFVFARNNSANSGVVVYACDNPANEAETVRMATVIGTAIGNSGSFGEVVGSFWRNFDGLRPQHGAITFVVDDGDDETKKAEELKRIISAELPAASYIVEPNKGDRTDWMTSVIVCP